LTAAPETVVDRLHSAHAAGRRLLLLFDYDGTLTPIAAHPALARLGEPMRRVLRYLAYRSGVAVGVLSGRRLQDLRDMVRLPGLYYAGTAGLELDLAGERLLAPGAAEARPLVDAALQCWRGLAADYPGAWVEAKEFGLTLHFREVDVRQTAQLCARARQALEAGAGPLRVLHGPRALEATLPLGWDKGTAVQKMAERTTGLRLPDGTTHHSPLTTHHSPTEPPIILYAGDSENDRDAFEVVRARKGVTLGVGPAAPALAEHRLADPVQLEEILVRLLRALP
jgi:trehalose-phosphatase